MRSEATQTPRALAVVRRTHKQTNKYTDSTQQLLQYTAQLSAQCNNILRSRMLGFRDALPRGALLRIADDASVFRQLRRLNLCLRAYVRPLYRWADDAVLSR